MDSLLMHLTFLGTSCGAPTRTRNVPCVALTFDTGRVWLVDCGEATQHQLLRSPLSPTAVDRILITHLHGDHAFGLFGLLASLSMNGRTKELTLVGPIGVQELLQTVFRITETFLSFPITFTELVPDETKEMMDERGVHVTAVPISHRIPCFAFIIRDPDHPGRLDAELAASKGVPRGPDMGRLARGENITLPDGTIVRSSDVRGPPRKGRCIVIMGDTCSSERVADLVHECDILVHEATFDDSLEEQAKKSMHSTVSMCGHFARSVGARILVMTHFSPRYNTLEGPFSVASLRNTAQEIAGEGIRVLAAEDHMEVRVPLLH